MSRKKANSQTILQQEGRDEFKCPWIYGFGNHDPEGGFGREAIAEVFSKSAWGVLGKHIVTDNYTFKYDYVVNIRYRDDKNPAWQIYGFDSGSEKGFKSIKKDQLKWYEEKTKETVVKYGTKVPALAMFHIPLLEFESLRKNNTIQKYGRGLEKVSYEEDDGTVYKKFLQAGNIKAVLAGHDHYNNFWGTYTGGIILSYGFISGASTKHAWPVGGKLITLSPNGKTIGLKNVSPGYDAYNGPMVN